MPTALAELRVVVEVDWQCRPDVLPGNTDSSGHDHRRSGLRASGISCLELDYVSVRGLRSSSRSTRTRHLPCVAVLYMASGYELSERARRTELYGLDRIDMIWTACNGSVDFG
jgi:hypothetical protein